MASDSQDAHFKRSGQKMCNPLKNEWPKISEEDDTKLLHLLASIFEKYKGCLRCVKKGPKWAPKAEAGLTEEEEQQKQRFKSWMVLGANRVMKGLERDSLSLVLLCSHTQPMVLKEAVLSLVVSRRCPAACVSRLLGAIQPSWPRLSSLTAMGIKKNSAVTDFRELEEFVTGSIPQPNIPEIPHLVPTDSADIGNQASVPQLVSAVTLDTGNQEPDNKTMQEQQQSKTEYNINSDKNLSKVVDPTKYYVYKSDVSSSKTFNGQDFLSFEKDAPCEVCVNVVNGKVDIHRDMGDTEVYGIVPPVRCGDGDDNLSKGDRQDRKRPAGGSSYKGLKVKQAKRDMTSAKQKRKAEKRDRKKLKKERNK